MQRLASQKSTLAWESGDADNPTPVLTSRDRDALDGMAHGFSTLLRADMGRAVGVSIDGVAVGGVIPEHGLQPRSGSWRDWAAGSLNVSAITDEGGGGGGGYEAIFASKGRVGRGVR